MKKFIKFCFTLASLAALAVGAYYFVKKFVLKECPEDRDYDCDCDCNCDCEDSEVPDTIITEKKGNRKYVTIPVSTEDEACEEAADNEAVTEEAATEEVAKKAEEKKPARKSRKKATKTNEEAEQ